jgi:hypothetical protein
MSGGIGGYWGAIRLELEPNYRGSTWGANPPLSNTVAWNEITRYASWLGLDFLRVGLDQRMYEPQRGVYSWDNEEMQTLYRILDWAEANHADVFLSQLWQHVDWNVISGFTSKSPGLEVISTAPRSLTDFADGMATMIDHLQRVKGYTCIKWLNIVNEPGGYWWLGGPSLLDGLKAVHQAFIARGITLPLSGPGITSLWEKDAPLFLFTRDGTQNDEFAGFGGAYDTHTYDSPAGVVEPLGNWATFAHTRNMAFFLTEFGDMSLPWGGASPGPASFDAVLSNTSKVLQGLNAGVDGFSRWSYLNRGDQDGQWQMVRTWDITTRQYLATPVPEPVPYYGYAMLSRWTAKHSDILDVTGTTCGWTSALRSPTGELTIVLLNQDASTCTTNVLVAGLQTSVTFDTYTLTESALISLETPVILTVDAPQATVTLPPRSITTLTTFRLSSGDAGVIENQTDPSR